MILAAGLCLMPTRPRLVADVDGVRLRSFLGGWRTVPWDLIMRVEFPSNCASPGWCCPARRRSRSTRSSALDREQAIAAMRGLRRLFAAADPAEAD